MLALSIILLALQATFITGAPIRSDNIAATCGAGTLAGAGNATVVVDPELAALAMKLEVARAAIEAAEGGSNTAPDAAGRASGILNTIDLAKAGSINGENATEEEKAAIKNLGDVNISVADAQTASVARQAKNDAAKKAKEGMVATATLQ